MIAVLNLVLTLLPGHPTYYQVPSAILAKTYSNSMMVLLNSRIKLGSREVLQIDDFDTAIRIPVDTSINSADDYELKNERQVARERVVLAGADSLPTSFKVIVLYSDLRSPSSSNDFSYIRK